MVCRELRRRPLPHVADHVDKAEVVRGKCADRRCPDPAERAVIAVREPALPGVGHQLTAGSDVVAPRVGRGGATAGRVLPLRLGRQPTACPARVGRRVGVGDLHHRMVEPVIEVPAPAVRAERVVPVRAGYPVPPLLPIAQIHWTVGRPEHHRTRHQIRRRRVRIQRRIRGLLGDGDVTGVGDEFGELGVGHRMALDGVGADGRGVHRRLFRIELR